MKANLFYLLVGIAIYLLIGVDASAQPNDECAGAIAIACGDLIAGSTAAANPDTAPFCGTSDGTAGGVWYSLVGDGSDVTLSTCNAGSNYDTKIRVYEDGCGVLTCVEGDDDDFDCGFSTLRSTVTFTSVVGTNYSILVHGFGSSVGDFELSVECVVPNDECADAIPIVCGDLISGSTSAANSDTAPFCGTSDGTAGGVWYSLVGDGSDVTLSTCNAGSNYDTKIRVYEDGCGVLTCVEGDDDDFDCGFSTLRSTVTFTSVLGTNYSILVHGFGSSAGDFELSVECTVPNDECTGAIPIACGDLVSGSTVGAGADVEDFCGTSDSTGGGVWYSLVGDGSDVTLSTCNAGTNYDTKLRVYEGGCAGLVCVDGDDDDPDCGFSTLRSTVTFTSVLGTNYSILVHGFGSSVGDFELSVECAVPNDECTGAIPIACGDLVSGSTVGAGADVEDFCGTSDGTGGGVWYSFAGDGSSVTLSTCNAGTDYDTKLRVYEGGCAGLVCVDGDDDDPDCGFSTLRSTVTFTSVAGTNYSVLVHGFGSAEGDFELSVDCTSPPPNDECTGAIPIACGDLVSGSTVGAGADVEAFCGTSDGTGGGLWYSFAGNDELVTFSTCNAGTNYDTKLRVYEGACGGLTCVDGNDDDFDCGFGTLRSTVTVCAEAGVDYYVLVHGFGSNEGDFELSVACETFQIDVSSTDVSCNGGSDGTATVNITNGTGTETILWSDGQATATATGLSAGIYTVTVDGCGSATASVFIKEPTIVECPVLVTDVSCNGGSDGVVKVFASGGTSPYTYSWSNGASADTATDLATGTYAVTVTDANGCECFNSAFVGEPDPLTLDPVYVQNNSLEGLGGGVTPFYYNTHQIQFMGGTPPYNLDVEHLGYVNWSLSYTDTGATITIIYADNAEWAVTIMDANGCTLVDGEISNDSSGEVGSGSDILDIDSSEINGESGVNECDGSIDLTMVGCSAGDITYEWSGPSGFTATTEDATELCGGWYTVTATCSDGQTTEGWYWVPVDRGGGRLKAGNSISMDVYPNPFVETSILEFATNNDEYIKLDLYGANGQLLHVLFEGQAKANQAYNVSINAKDLGLVAGTYHCVLVGEDGVLERRQLMVVR